jgi:hypothetical protein
LGSLLMWATLHKASSSVWWRRRFLVTAPVAGGLPDLVVRQPLARPWDDGLGDEHARPPLSVPVQAQGSLPVDVRQRLAGSGVEPGTEHNDLGVAAGGIGDLHCVGAAERGRLDDPGPDEPARSNLAPGRGESAPERQPLLGRAKDAGAGSGHRGRCVPGPGCRWRPQASPCRRPW